MSNKIDKGFCIPKKCNNIIFKKDLTFFPVEGNPNTLYVDSDHNEMYTWDIDTNSYILISSGDMNWGDKEW